MRNGPGARTHRAAAAAGGDTLTTLVAKRIAETRQTLGLDAVVVPCALALG